jgi:2-aminoethylphosphonate-pyruvate transaminase
MKPQSNSPDAPSKILFTPGPLTTSPTVKQAMLHDLGSRDDEFISLVLDVRRRLLAIGGVGEPDYTAVLMPGSGTFGVEAVLSSALPRDAHLMVLVNGAYGRRMVDMASVLNITHDPLIYPEHAAINPNEVDAYLTMDPTITDVAVVHCETTSGLVNPIREIGAVVKHHQCRYIVDAMSSFGGLPFQVDDCGIDYLISSANKCIQGVPGFSFVLARREELLDTRGYARTLSLDLFAQWQELESSGQFRFTPPTHVVLAFHQALLELEAEGGVARRALRYGANQRVLVEGMRRLGFETYLPAELQGPIITSFRYPRHPRFDFRAFYESLSAQGFVIYPGKVSRVDCFRIGSIGDITPDDVHGLLAAVETTLAELGISMRETA